MKSPIQYLHLNICTNNLLFKSSRLNPPLNFTMQDFIIDFTSLIPVFGTWNIQVNLLTPSVLTYWKKMNWPSSSYSSQVWKKFILNICVYKHTMYIIEKWIITHIKNIQALFQQFRLQIILESHFWNCNALFTTCIFFILVKV